MTGHVTIMSFVPSAELVHNVLEEPQVRMSTPKKLSVSSEQMEPTFKKVTHNVIIKCSLSLPIKELRQRIQHNGFKRI